MSTRTEERQVVRGRRERPRDRLPTSEAGFDVQPVRFTSGIWAVILFISTETMFFGALFTTYFFLLGRLPAWEPIFQRCVDACEKPTWHSQTDIFGITLPLVAINTIALVSSSLTMQLAVNAIKKGDRKRLRNWLIPTIVLGAIFITGQGYEYTRLGFLPDNGVFAGVFFTLTGFHGAHVSVGVLVLLSMFVMSTQGRLTEEHSLAVELAGLYWHFVDIVWIVIFTLVYLIQ